MEQVLVHIVDKLPSEYIMVAIPVMIAFLFLYVAPRVRRDKQGKLYWHSNIYEQRKYSRKQDELLHEIKATKDISLQNRLDILGIQLQEMIYHTPKETIKINEVADIYIKAGGNGHIKSIYEDWKSKS